MSSKDSDGSPQLSKVPFRSLPAEAARQIREGILNGRFRPGERLVEQKLAPRFANIWLVGGAMLCHRFLELDLVSEIKLTIAPVLLGSGLRLFSESLPETQWALKNVVAYKNGFVELTYASR